VKGCTLLQDVDGCRLDEMALHDKWQQVEAAVEQDQELNNLLWQAAADNMDLFAALYTQQASYTFLHCSC